MTVTEGESVTLECQISGHPTPAIMWFREDYRIEHSIDFQITYENSYARLVIREAFAEDSGRFTCTATSEAGTISTSCYLLVKGKIIWVGLKQNDLCNYRLIFIDHFSFSVSEDIESREDFSTVSEHIEMSAHERQWVDRILCGINYIK